MEVLAVTKGVRMSPLKVRAVARQIQGMHALEAQALLASVPRKSARLVSKTLKSAMANAENIADEWDVEELQGRIAELEQKVSSTNNKRRAVARRQRLMPTRVFWIHRISWSRRCSTSRKPRLGTPRR